VFLGVGVGVFVGVVGGKVGTVGTAVVGVLGTGVDGGGVTGVLVLVGWVGSGVTGVLVFVGVTGVLVGVDVLVGTGVGTAVLGAPSMSLYKFLCGMISSTWLALDHLRRAKASPLASLYSNLIK